MIRLGISQTFRDEMLSDGLPYANIGHGRWITGQSLRRGSQGRRPAARQGKGQ
jgi:hypothetical protein